MKDPTLEPGVGFHITNSTEINSVYFAIKCKKCITCIEMCLLKLKKGIYFVFLRLNRDSKQDLEMDWSDKKEALETDTKSGVLRNHHTNKQFYPGAAKFEEM